MGLHRRSVEVLIGSATLGAVLWSASTACSTGGSTGPPATDCQQDAAQLTCIGFTLNVIADGPYMFTFRGFSYSASRDSTFFLANLVAGPYEIAGRMSTPNVTFYVVGRSSTVPGGVERTSLQSVQGPFVATPSLCHVSYAATGASPPPQDFRFQFTVGTVPPTC
jgi:hypothetical protein